MKNYDKEKYKIWNWKHPMMLHWIINPGVAVSEFVGVVTPKVLFIEKDNSKGLAERTYIPCPHCDTIHSGLKWSKQNNTHNKNWYGYHCDNCQETIPPLRNWFSALVFGALKPFNNNNRERWKAAQPARFENLNMTFEAKKITIKKGLKISLFFGGFMFVFMTLYYWLLGESLSTNLIIMNAVLWLIGGLCFGFIMRAFANRQIEKSIKSRQGGKLEADS
nr:hypothetical protein [Nonlabens ulvanivorans]